MLVRAVASFMFGLGVYTTALAQSSTVAITPREGATSVPVLSKPFEVLDTDYPLESLLANEQGKVTLAFDIDGAGSPTGVSITSSSGVIRLDQQAMQLVKARLLFVAVGQAANVTIDWKLPLTPVEKFHVNLPPSAPGTLPPKPANTHPIIASDYPADSVRLAEGGTAVLRYLVKVDGTVGDAIVERSSGIPRLDVSAAAIIKRWKFEPATLEGNAVLAWKSASVVFSVIPNATFPQSSAPRCFELPETGDDAEEQVLITASLIGGQPIRAIDRWTRVTRDNKVEDVIIKTDRGPMRLSAPLVAQFASIASYPRPNTAAGCWYREQIPLRR